jgi:hypothetical protein
MTLKFIDGVALTQNMLSPSRLWRSTQQNAVSDREAMNAPKAFLTSSSSGGASGIALKIEYQIRNSRRGDLKKLAASLRFVMTLTVPISG